MKKGLLGSTALIGAAALLAGTAGVAGAAEAPEYKLSGGMNFQVYIPSGDITGVTDSGSFAAFPITGPTSALQDASLYFGVDEAELHLTVSGAADNGLNYGFKIEMQTNTSDGTVADEARLQLSGSWGTLQMGDEDGAEDSMNFGAENLLGAAGSWDGDGDDVMGDFAGPFFPTIAGDTSDHTKVTYYSPRFSGFQVGASYTPEPAMDGDEIKNDSDVENHFGLGANYDNSFGDVRVRASAVYSMSSAKTVGEEDVGAFSVGGIVGFGPFSVAANYTDNGESGAPTGAGFGDSYWNVGAGFESGPIYLSATYFSRTAEATGAVDGEASAIGLTADYSVAPGLGVYAEYTLYDLDDADGLLVGGFRPASMDESVIILGANVSF